MLNNIVKEILNGVTRIVGWGLTTLVIALVDGWMDGMDGMDLIVGTGYGSRLCKICKKQRYWRIQFQSFRCCTEMCLTAVGDKEEGTQNFGLFININVHLNLKYKHRKNCECCPGHYLIVNHYSSI